MQDSQPPADMESRFIAAAVLPFSNNAETTMAGEDYVRKQLPAKKDGDLAPSIARWEVMDRRKLRGTGRVAAHPWQLALWLLLAISFLILAALTANLVAQRMKSGLRQPFEPLYIFYHYPRVDQESVSRGLEPRQRFLLFGNPSEGNPVARAKALWDSDPANSSFFANYAAAHLDAYMDLPPDFIGTARRIDSGNSWYLYLAAGNQARDSVEVDFRGGPGPPAPGKVLDPVKFAKALDLLHQAAAQPVYHDPCVDLWKQRAALLPRDSPAGRTYSISYLLRNWNLRPDTDLYELAEVISTKAAMCEEEQDPGAFRELLADSGKFIHARMDAEVATQAGEYASVSLVEHTLASLAPAARKLGLVAEADRMELAGKRVDPLIFQNESEEIASTKRRARAATKGGSLLKRLDLGDTASGNEEELKPGRMVDHSLAACGLSVVTALLLLPCLVATALYRFRASAMIRGLARRAESLFSFRDWACVLILGVALPVAWTFAVVTLTPLGGNGMAIGHTTVRTLTGDDLNVTGLQFLGLLMLILLSCASIVGWRLGKRMPLPAFHPLALPVGWLMVAITAAFIPGIGWAAVNHSPGIANQALLAGCLPLIWLIFLAVVALASPSGRLWYLVTASRILVTAFSFASLLMLLTAALSLDSAYKWFAADELIKLDPIHPAMTAREHEAALKMRNDLRQALGYEP